MRTVIVVDPKKQTPITRMNTQKEPQEGEPVELVTELFGDVVGAGVVQNVRPFPGWIGRYLYDVERKL